MRILIYIIFLIHNFKIHLYVVSDEREIENLLYERGESV